MNGWNDFKNKNAGEQARKRYKMIYKSRRHFILLVSYLLGLILSVLNIKLAISIGVVTGMIWVFNWDHASYQMKTLKMKGRN